MTGGQRHRCAGWHAVPRVSRGPPPQPPTRMAGVRPVAAGEPSRMVLARRRGLRGPRSGVDGLDGLVGGRGPRRGRAERPAAAPGAPEGRRGRCEPGAGALPGRRGQPRAAAPTVRPGGLLERLPGLRRRRRGDRDGCAGARRSRQRRHPPAGRRCRAGRCPLLQPGGQPRSRSTRSRRSAEPARESEEAFDDAAAALEAVDEGGLLGPVATSFNELRSIVLDARATLGSAYRAADLMPSLLGAETARDHLLVFENNAELRSMGGLAGSISLIHADDGEVEIMEQEGTSKYLGLQRPVIPLTAGEQAGLRPGPRSVVHEREHDAGRHPSRAVRCSAVAAGDRRRRRRRVLHRPGRGVLPARPRPARSRCPATAR